jgi:hypothetical protein
MGSKQFLNSMYRRQRTTVDNQGKRVEVSPDVLIYTTVDVETRACSH